MRFASLGSGSRGNGLVVEVKQTRLLLDCGFGVGEAIRRLGRLGSSAQDLAGILITHEHADHIGGAVRLARKFGLTVWLTHGTFSAIPEKSRMSTSFTVIDSHRRFSIQDIEIEPFPVPHDAREPIQFVFGDGQRRLGVLTDTGSSTPHIEMTLNGCDALVIECNHDEELLRTGAYPPALKRRIAGRFGHLDNDSAARLLASINCTRLQHVIAAHLSEKNNTPELARAGLSRALNCTPDWIGVADQENGLDWRELR
jgi:phosphoribosyl 1,2-cyclic phosphodiesterase